MIGNYVYKNAHVNGQDIIVNDCVQNLIYNDLKDYSLQHDSYLCKRFPLSVPYPTRREGGFFLGAPV